MTTYVKDRDEPSVMLEVLRQQGWCERTGVTFEVLGDRVLLTRREPSARNGFMTSATVSALLPPVAVGRALLAFARGDVDESLANVKRSRPLRFALAAQRRRRFADRTFAMARAIVLAPWWWQFLGAIAVGVSVGALVAMALVRAGCAAGGVR